MIDTTKDIFWLIAGISLGIFTFFICWTMYYIIMMVRDVNKMVASFKQKIELVDKILELIKDKLDKTSSHLSLVTDSILKVAGFFLDKQNDKKDKKKKA